MDGLTLDGSAMEQWMAWRFLEGQARRFLEGQLAMDETTARDGRLGDKALDGLHLTAWQWTAW
jgi:hypothetical protein